MGVHAGSRTPTPQSCEPSQWQDAGDATVQGERDCQDVVGSVLNMRTVDEQVRDRCSVWLCWSVMCDLLDRQDRVIKSSLY